MTNSISPDIRGLIFDCDGTLVDSMPIHHACWHETFAHFGESCPPDFLPPFNGMPSRLIIAEYNNRFGRSIDTNAFTAEKDRRADRLLRSVQPIVEVTSIVEAYHGRLPMAVASGGKKRSVMRSLNAVGLVRYFDAIVTADDPVDPKPQPGIFLEAARKIGVGPEACLVFEDGDLGIVAARRAGMAVVDVREFIHADAR